jgi:hypothetical protein
MPEGEPPRRISRCSWTVFLAAAVALHLAARALDPTTGVDAVVSRAAAAVRWAAAAALAAKLGGLAWERRRPRLVDAHDWAAILCAGILVLTAGAVLSVGETRGARGLAEPAAIAAMLLVVRGQCVAVEKARWLARLATASAVMALVVWSVTR